MYNRYYGPWSSRLQARNYGATRGGWLAKVNNNRQWLQIDLGAKSVVKRISTQGRYDANQWVTAYTVSYSNSGVRFYPYRENRRVRVSWRMRFSGYCCILFLFRDSFLVHSCSIKPLIPKSAIYQNSRRMPNFILQNIEKQMVPCKSSAKEVSFEWSYQRISSTDSKVRTTLPRGGLHNYSGWKRV